MSAKSPFRESRIASKFLSLGDNEGIPRLSWQVVFQAQNFMPDPSQRMDDFIGDAMVCEESQPH
jgi:hypothetical protein